MLWRRIKQKGYFVRGQGCNLKRVAREDFIEIVIFKQRLEGSEGARSDPCGRRVFAGRKGTLYADELRLRPSVGLSYLMMSALFPHAHLRPQWVIYCLL